MSPYSLHSGPFFTDSLGVFPVAREKKKSDCAITDFFRASADRWAVFGLSLESFCPFFRQTDNVVLASLPVLVPDRPSSSTLPNPLDTKSYIGTLHHPSWTTVNMCVLLCVSLDSCCSCLLVFGRRQERVQIRLCHSTSWIPMSVVDVVEVDP